MKFSMLANYVDLRDIVLTLYRRLLDSQFPGQTFPGYTCETVMKNKLSCSSFILYMIKAAY